MNTKTISVSSQSIGVDQTFIQDEGIITGPVKIFYDTRISQFGSINAIKALFDYGDGKSVIQILKLGDKSSPDTFSNALRDGFTHAYVPTETFLTPITAVLTVIFGNLSEHVFNIRFDLRQNSITETGENMHIIDTQLLPNIDDDVFMAMESGLNNFGFNMVAKKTNTLSLSS